MIIMDTPWSGKDYLCECVFKQCEKKIEEFLLPCQRPIFILLSFSSVAFILAGS